MGAGFLPAVRQGATQATFNQFLLGEIFWATQCKETPLPLVTFMNFIFFVVLITLEFVNSIRAESSVLVIGQKVPALNSPIKYH